MTNPISKFFENKKLAASQRAERDLEYWHHWNNNGRKPEHLEPLLQSFKPVIAQAVNKYRAPTVSKSAFAAEATKLVIKAFSDYDPNRAALATFVIGHMPKLQREGNRVQNKAYIPEGKASLIGHIQRAQSQLRGDLDREPTIAEVAQHLGKTEHQVHSVLGAMKKDIVASQFDTDPTKTLPARMQEILDFLPESLKPDERQVFEYIYGQNGKPKITETNGIALAVGKNPSQVSRIRTAISAKIDENMKRHF